MKNIILSLVLLVAAHTAAAAPAPDDAPIYCGGEGPHPMVDISQTVVSGMGPVTTSGSVQDFMMMENHNEIIYRNSQNELYSTSLKDNTTTKLSNMEMPLARITDPNENYVVSDGNTYLYDIGRDQWNHFTGPTGPIEHLFWNKAGLPLLKRWSLYSLSQGIRDSRGVQTFRLYEYNPDHAKASYCEFTAGPEWRLTKGRTAPYVVMFKEEPTDRGRLVTFAGVTTNCFVKSRKKKVHVFVPYSYPLEDVYHFSNLGATAFKFNHPEKSLVWWDGKRQTEVGAPLDSCEVYNIHKQKPIFLNDTRPVMATWSAKKGGLNLFFLGKSAKKASILPDLPLTHVDSRYLWLSRDGGRLFFSPEISREGASRQILQINLRQPD